MLQHAQEVHRGPIVLETAAKLLFQLHGEKDGQQALGQIPEVLRLPQNAQKVQFILECASRLLQNHLEKKGWPPDSWVSFRSTSDASTCARGPQRSNCPGDRGQTPFRTAWREGWPTTLGYIPEVLQLPQNAQKVQFILESAAHLLQNHLERKGGHQTLG